MYRLKRAVLVTRIHPYLHVLKLLISGQPTFSYPFTLTLEEVQVTKILFTL
ncbi:UNVERIFIED_ORG: hypothetical protein ABIC97_005564 [Peribacillus simplex]